MKKYIHIKLLLQWKQHYQIYMLFTNLLYLQMKQGI